MFFVPLDPPGRHPPGWRFFSPFFRSVQSHQWLVVCLGNPGAQYVWTRHNIGWLAGDVLAAHYGYLWREERPWQALVAGKGAMIIMKPLSFMNRSGHPTQSVAAFYKIPPAQILVIADDVNLSFGRLRLRTAGSDGGHNGLRSVADVLGTSAFPRLRIGIGGARPEERQHSAQALADFVLAGFSEAETQALPDLLAKVVLCMESVLQSGIDVAMNTFNVNAADQKRCQQANRSQPSTDVTNFSPEKSA